MWLRFTTYKRTIVFFILTFVCASCVAGPPPPLPQPPPAPPAPPIDPTTTPPSIGPAVPGTNTTPYRVTLLGSSVQLLRPNGTVSTYSINPAVPGSITSLLVRGSTRVSGAVNYRFTLAARTYNSTTANSGEAADIVITGNTGTAPSGSVPVLPASPPTSKASLGLIAQGNIILNLRPTCITMIRAAMYAQTGAVTIPPDYISQIRKSGAAPDCPSLRIDGSIISHRLPIFRWTWPVFIFSPADSAGFTSRVIRWDANLQQNPPPYFPKAGPWQVISTHPANEDCLTEPVLNLNCR